MRRITAVLAATLLALSLLSGAAIAMEPPGKGAQDNVGCVDGEDDPIGGHPGSRGGLTDATFKLMERDGQPTAGHPTTWIAVEHADPIEFGEC